MLDKFYTKPDIAKYCYEQVLGYVDKDDLLIEPSAGDGSFFLLFRSPSIGLDIAPEHPQILKSDWFDYVVPTGSVVVGNPPFGTRNDLSKKFIKHSVTNAKCVAFILPTVFKKETLQAVFPEKWKLVFQYNLPKNSFLLDKKDYHVPCVFQIWINPDYYHHIWTNNYRKSSLPRLTTKDFRFGGWHSSRYFVFGAAPHRIIPKEEVKPENRGYFFNSYLTDIKDRFANIDWKKHALSSVNGGVSWFTKQQIIDAYVETYGKKEK